MTAYVYSWAIIAASVSTYATLKHQDREKREKWIVEHLLMPMDNQTYIHASIQKYFAQNTFLQQCTADGCLRDKFE